MREAMELTGKKFGRLLVLEKCNNYHKKGRYWLCECDCGNQKIVNAGCLLSGTTKSCGCLYKESRYANTTHNKSHTRIYNIWCHIKARCYRKTHKDFKDYGGRGIIVCEEWKTDFVSFYNWAMKNGYNENLSIDRIDVDDGYNPSNCRWANDKMQARNKRNNHKLTLNGETRCISEWTELLGFKPKVISDRINKLGWSIEKALTTPLQTQKGENNDIKR